MAQYCQATRERVIALVEEGHLSASEAARRYGVGIRTAQYWIRRYRESGESTRRDGSGHSRVSNVTQDETLIAAALDNPFLNSRQLLRVTGFPGCDQTIRNRLRDSGLYSRHVALRSILTEEHKLYRYAFALDNVEKNWRNVIFTDECTFSSVNEGPLRVYRPRSTRYERQYTKMVARSGRFSVSVWGWMSADGLGILHRIQGKLNAEQYLHILKNVMIPSVRHLYPEGTIEFQQDNAPIHTAQLIQNWLSNENYINLIDWPPCSPDLNPIENVWAETKRVLRENWVYPGPRNADELWLLVHEAWEEVAHSENYAKRLVNSMPRRMNLVVEEEGSWIPY